MWKFFETLGIQLSWLDKYSWYQGAAIAASLAVGMLLVFGLKNNKERDEYFLQAIAELRKVTWPSAAETKQKTIVVCVVVGIFAVILSVFDLVWTKALALLLG